MTVWRKIRRRHGDPQYRLMVVVDMVGSGRWHDRTQLQARAVLDGMARSAFRAAGIGWHRLVVEDRGDGMIVLIPGIVSKVDLFDPLLPFLSAALRSYNATSDPRIRLRVAIHAGEVLRGGTGWVGTDLNLACRLVNSSALYRELLRHPEADLVLVVSEVIHQAVVRHGHRGIDPAAYVPAHIAVKEVDARAWVHVPVAEPGPNLLGGLMR